VEIVYDWQYTDIQVELDSEGLQDVVVSTQWRRIAASVDGQYTAFSQGQAGFPPPDPNDFIPFQDLTKEEMTTWVIDVLGQSNVNGIDATLASQIETAANPTVVVKPAPWGPADGEALSDSVQ
jgi:hypothetical protein